MPHTTGRIRTVFFGTPGYAEPALRALATSPEAEVVLVVTQPDRPAGRGRALTAPRVKLVAEELGLPVYQPEHLRTAEARQPLEQTAPDLFVVAAFGLIFGRKTLAIPRYGCVNLHASLLPKYRGASPVTAAILAGDRVTGVTLMRMDAGMDTGEVIGTIETPIAADDTTGTLTDRLAWAGAELLVRSLRPWIDGELPSRPQSAAASLVRPLVKVDGWVDWRADAEWIERQVRAMQPWPRAFTTLPSGVTMQILSTSIANDAADAPPGTLFGHGKGFAVACGAAALELGTVQLAGSGPTPAEALVRGRKLNVGDVLGALGAPMLPGPLIVPVE